MGSRILLLTLCLPAGSLSAEETRTTLPESLNDALSAVADRTDLAFEEAPAYYGILEHVRSVSPKGLAAAAQEVRRERHRSSPRQSERPESEFSQFADMVEHPDQYRGRPVSLSGHVIRLVKYPAGPNEFGIDTLYEAWLVTEDSQQHPSTVIFTEVPEGMPIGEEIIDGVSVSGYFLKLHTYPSRDKKIRLAPMILADTLRWRPPQQAASAWGSATVWYGGMLVLVLAITATVWMSIRRHRRLRERLLRQSLPNEPPEFLKSMPS